MEIFDLVFNIFINLGKKSMHFFIKQCDTFEIILRRSCGNFVQKFFIKKLLRENLEIGWILFATIMGKILMMRKTLSEFVIISFKIFSLQVIQKELLKLCKWSKIDCRMLCVQGRTWPHKTSVAQFFFVGCLIYIFFELCRLYYILFLTTIFKKTIV